MDRGAETGCDEDGMRRKELERVMGIEPRLGIRNVLNRLNVSFIQSVRVKHL